MLLNIILAVVGFALLIKSADFFVEGAASFAKNFRLPTSVIGLTIVAFGTSAPEIAISFSSHLSGNTDILFGNVIGSNISNVFIILGISVLIIPIKIHSDIIKKEMPILMLTTVAVAVLFLDAVLYGTEYNTLSRADGVILILFFLIFVYYLISILMNKPKKDEGEEEEAKPKYKVPKSLLFIAGGLVGVIFGSELVVNNAAAFAEGIGISQKIISVTIISIGTSLPELVTIVSAARKGEDNMAIGSIVGSNIFNICIVLGMPAIIVGAASTSAFGIVDIAFLVLSVAFLWVFALTERKLKRYEGVLLIAVYAGYIGYIFSQ